MDALIKVKDNIEKLQDISSKLDNLIRASNSKLCLITNYSIQYDYFMEFVHLHQDTVDYLNKIPECNTHILEIRRNKKILTKFWNHFNINITAQ